jgi:putative copper resistance protein D
MIAAARGVYFAATLLLFGLSAFAFLLRARLPMILPLRDAPLRWVLLLIALVSGSAWLGLAAAAMADAMDGRAVMITATDTLFGQFFLARMAALSGIALLLLLRHGHGRLKSALTVVLSALALVLPAATSHAAAASPAGFAAIGGITDAVHLLTAGFWIGGLALLLLLFRRGEPNMILALSLFSDWGMGAVLLLVMTGLINSASILLAQQGSPSPLYLGALGAKLALVAGMIGLALVNRFRLMSQGHQARIARHTAIELGAGLMAALLAGLLGQLQPLH